MAYGDFDLRKVTTDFGLVCEQDTDLFADAAPVPPSDELRKWLDRFAALALGLGSDLARAAYLLGPIFGEGDAPRQLACPRLPRHHARLWTRTAG